MAAQASKPQRGGVINLHDKAVPSAQLMIAGGELRAHRNKLDLTLEEATAALDFSASKLSRMETGHHKFKPRDVIGLCDVYGVGSPAERERLLDLVSHANLKPWYQDWTDVAGKALQAFMSFEDAAQRIRTYEPHQLPGLMQTPGYARAVIEKGPRSIAANEVDRLVALRQERVDRFNRAAPTKKLICVIDEATLWRGFGNEQIMLGQLDRLIELAQLPRYQVRIAELRRFNLPVMLGPTTIFDFAEKVLPDIVYSEHFDGALLIQDKKQVDRRDKAFDRLRQLSLEPGRSLQLLRDLRKSF